MKFPHANPKQTTATAKQNGNALTTQSTHHGAHRTVKRLKITSSPGWLRGFPMQNNGKTKRQRTDHSINPSWSPPHGEAIKDYLIPWVVEGIPDAKQRQNKTATH